MTAKLFIWDHAEQPDLADLGEAVSALTRRGRPAYLRDVPWAAIQSDQYAAIVSDVELTDEQAGYFFEHESEPVLIEVTIEPSWTINHSRDVIEIGLGELIGLEGTAREAVITEAAGDYVNNVCSWGATELLPEEDSDD
jgi:hypothetical protein